MLEAVKCPSCGGSLNLTGNEGSVKCEFCGSFIRITPKEAKAASQTLKFIDKQTGYTVASAKLPSEFEAIGMIIPNLSSYTYPIELSCSTYDKSGTVMTYFTGEAFTDRSKCPLLSGPYSEGVNKINRVTYKNFRNAEEYLSDYIQDYASKAKATSLKLIDTRPIPIDGFSEDKALAMLKYRTEGERQRSGDNGQSKELGYYLKPICQTYEMGLDGSTFKVAIALILEGVKTGLPAAPAMPTMPIAGLGGLLGGLLGQIQQPQATSEAPTPNASGFAAMPDNAIIEWACNGLFMLQTPLASFEEKYNTVFKQFCSTFEVDNEIKKKSYNMQDKILADIANYTHQNIQMQQQQFAAWQQANATRQAAFDAANQAWWDRNNSSWASYRASNAAAESSSDRISRLQSEAIRGVNTYTREDGSEVEVSVDYDHAYSNGLNDTLATNSSFAPGGNWTEMNRKL